ncbi:MULTISPECIES: hydantoinase B/oxoprolinase family protein [Rhizobium/Agrobacterium group]|uniref:Hydantoinase B/oxoprolinase family protein n=2 Tax=Neorhizobium TaxID=1525371 RepID=A0ABV0M5V1_9HYPH|nr:MULTISPECIES: hydantoinase B/oxoprolinase family protein [Rhizobium/Agrobacterium group]KGE01552.1 methylhydantoinase [Rhizobium sp. YS-1r]MCC2610964.1 hydantoinase B/oxoprolinase family protein [Neorhizobium petrolearium]
MDAVRTAIMSNRFNAIVEEASAAVYRTAHTTFVKLVQDYQCALATADGDMFAYPMMSGVNVFIGSPLRPTLNAIGRENLKPGDIIITNDPFATDGLVTHLMDVTLLYPIFRDGKLIAVGWSFVHASDIGGAVPGSISPAFTEVFQEGLRVRPVKLYEGGVLNKAIKSIFEDNSRIPVELWGDIQAMISGLKSMDRRIGELCDRYGRDAVEEGMNDVITYAEGKARAVIRTIPNGTYSFSDYLEGIHEGQLAYFSVTLTVHDGEIDVDFTGTDPQLSAAYNLVTGKTTHPYVVQCLITFILTMDPLTPRNSGILRAIHAHAPRGSVLNAVFPASGGSRAASATRAYDIIMGCLDQALPEGLGAAGAGMAGVIVVSAPDPRTGRDRVNVINTIHGGGGGRRGSDGVDGTEVRYSQRAVPVEIVEIETPIIMRATRIVPDSRRAGRFASGAALEMELENTANRAVMTVRNMNRFVFAPWGFKGGEQGLLGTTIVNPGRPDERSIGKISVLEMSRGDVVRITSPTGGGFGDPLERDLAAIQGEIDNDMLSPERAAEAYAVVLDENGCIDEAATAVQRSKRIRARQADFTFCAERERQDRVWPLAIRRQLASMALSYDQRIGSQLVGNVHRRMLAAGETVDPETLQKVVEAEAARLSGTKMKAS